VKRRLLNHTPGVNDGGLVPLLLAPQRPGGNQSPGGQAFLREDGVLYDDVPTGNIVPTTLRLSNYIEGQGSSITTFEMNLHNGDTEVYRTMLTGSAFAAAIGERLFKLANRAHGLADPTDQDYKLIYVELQRGATGLYPG